jgi:hypothetical protein
VAYILDIGQNQIIGINLTCIEYRTSNNWEKKMNKNNQNVKMLILAVSGVLLSCGPGQLFGLPMNPTPYPPIAQSIDSTLTLMPTSSSASILPTRLKTTDWKIYGNHAGDKQLGVAFVSWWPGQYSLPDADLALTNLRATGANWMSLLVSESQDTITSTTIYKTRGTPEDADLIHAINEAHSLGLKVMLKPHLDLANDPNHWTGQIGQGLMEAQWTDWFASYTTFIDHYAQLAQTNGADQFCVGIELSATEARTSQWRDVVKSVRSFYGGPVTYAANGGDEERINWWDIVDFIGVDAYYPLSNKNNPTIAELKSGWMPHITALGKLALTWNKKILFTEIGYRSQDGANQHPGDYQTAGAIDLLEQADAYQAAFESVFHQPWFAGMYWWSWGTDPLEGGPSDDGFTPHDKPAEDILRSWYGGDPRMNAAASQPDDSEVLTIYADGLNSGWEDWSWDSKVDFLSPSPVYRGAKAISVVIQPWGALSLHHINLDTSPYYCLEFYVDAATSGPSLQVYANDQNDSELRYLPVYRYADGLTIQPGVWLRVHIPLADMDAANRLIQRIAIKNSSSQAIQLWIDEIKLIPST